MTIETDLSALVTQTSLLLAEVIAQKQIIDDGVSAIDPLVEQVNAVSAQIGKRRVLSATSDITLTAVDAAYQLIDPNGANRNITLPAPGVSDAVIFAVKNTGTSFALTIKNAGGTVVGVPIASSYSLTVVWSGTKWEVM